MHVLPQLRKLERRFPAQLQVVSVHSPKFPTERETANLRQAVLRHRIEHPVLNDADFALWQQYGARAWPTLFFIDPNGDIIGKHEGEIRADAIQSLFEGWIDQYREAGILADAPLDLERETGSGSALSFPGKVHFDAESGRLFIADTNHDRIVVAGLDGNVEQVIGGADIGFNDGPPNEATFNQPQGMSIANNALYVADTENHAIRRINLDTWHTTTVAGVGQQADQMPQSAPGLQAQLNSPWDVAARDGTLYVAMAGFHQIWALQLDGGVIGPWAGSMREGIVDGPRAQAELAQPSGLSIGPSGLTFADSESSAVRQVSFDDNGDDAGLVTTLVGKGLFDFGDQDGDIGSARLQHPLDVAWVGDELYVADTFNHKIKRIYPLTQNVATLLGSLGDASAAGDGDSTFGPDGLGVAFNEARFNEPGGLCAGPGRSLIVADTNNHRIRVVDLEAGRVRTINLKLD